MAVDFKIDSGKDVELALYRGECWKFRHHCHGLTFHRPP